MGSGAKEKKKAAEGDVTVEGEPEGPSYEDKLK